MDVVRSQSKARKRLRSGVLLVVSTSFIVAITAGVSLLRPALPESDRSAVILDTVQRGTLVRHVAGTGMLVPVDVTLVTAEVSGQIVEVLVEPGVEVTPETELIKLRDSQMERTVREAERDVVSAQADLDRFKLQQQSLQLDLKVALVTARGNFEDARAQAEVDETMARRGLMSARQLRFSADKAERNEMLFEVQMERTANSMKTQDIQLQEKVAAVERSNDYLAERREQQQSLIVRAGVQGVLQQLGLSGADLEIGQRVAQGAVLAKISNPKVLKAVLSVSQIQARDIVEGQLATIDTRNGVISGTVTHIDPAVQNDRVTVEVELTGDLPKGARPDLSVEGLIEVARLEDVFFVRKPVYSQEGGRLAVFRLNLDGETVSRTTVQFGSGTVHSIEVVAGLKEGDQIVVSDTSRWKNFDQVKLK